jgi:hypothetical protein
MRGHERGLQFFAWLYKQAVMYFSKKKKRREKRGRGKESKEQRELA